MFEGDAVYNIKKVARGQAGTRNVQLVGSLCQLTRFRLLIYWLIFFYQSDLFLFRYLLTPWCTVLLEKLTGLQLVKKFPAFHGTRRFITALTSVRHLSLSWASPIQPIHPHPTYWRSVLILSTHLSLGLPSGLFPSGFLTKTPYTPLSRSRSEIMRTCKKRSYR